MSKLPLAPLIEVLFELRWQIHGAKEMEEIQYLHGDLFPLLKKNFPFRETIQNLPLELALNVPTHRFRAAENDYPLVQVGPGLVTVNTIDSKYYWDEFEALILEVVSKLSEVYTFSAGNNMRLVLQYIDLLEFNFEKSDILSYLNQYLNIKIEQSFYRGISKNLILGLGFKNDLGSLNVNISRGKNSKGVDGIAIHTNLMSDPIQFEQSQIKDWIGKAHELCSSSFKEMTKGSLYESFKSNNNEGH